MQIAFLVILANFYDNKKRGLLLLLSKILPFSIHFLNIKYGLAPLESSHRKRLKQDIVYMS